MNSSRVYTAYTRGKVISCHGHNGRKGGGNLIPHRVHNWRNREHDLIPLRLSGCGYHQWPTGQTRRLLQPHGWGTGCGSSGIWKLLTQHWCGIWLRGSKQRRDGGQRAVYGHLNILGMGFQFFFLLLHDWRQGQRGHGGSD